MQATNGTRCLWAAAAASLITGFLHSQSAISSSRELLLEQETVMRQNIELKTELYRLQSELAEAQGEARAYKELYNGDARVR